VRFRFKVAPPITFIIENVPEIRDLVNWHVVRRRVATT